jgi:hypothetical protein
LVRTISASIRIAALAAMLALTAGAHPTTAASSRPALPGRETAYLGVPSVRLDGPQTDTETTVAIEGAVLHAGTIEFDIAGEVQPGFSQAVRGFVGLAFNLSGPDRYECVYLRVANGRASSQEQRNHALQYISHPEYPWRRLREEKVSQYESYADIGEREWIHVRLVIEPARVSAYINGAPRPALAVDRLPPEGPDTGRLALWAAVGSTAHYRNLVITPAG